MKFKNENKNVFPVRQCACPLQVRIVIPETIINDGDIRE